MNKENLQGLDWQRWVMCLLALKLFGAIVVTFGEFSHPHIIRQVDTMGVALRYWSRWTLESSSPWPLIPAVLTAGDTSGITPMEFPLMNLLYAPFFSLPVEYARVAAWFVHVTVCACLTYWHYKVWKGKKILDLPAEQAALIVPLFGTALVFSGRFMPDYTAFLLVSCAVGLSWEDPKYLKSLLLCALGLLMKPTLVLVLVIGLFEPRDKIKKNIVWVAASVMITLLYYKPGLAFVKSISDYPTYFLTELRNPIKSAFEFFDFREAVFKLVTKDLYASPALAWILLIGAIWRPLGKKYWILIAIVTVQIILGAALDGAHSFKHIYYFIGTAFSLSLIVVAVVNNARSKWLASAVLICFLLSLIDLYSYEVKRTVSHLRGLGIYAQCSELKRSHPNFPWAKGFRFRSNMEEYPELGLCFGEIQNSKTSRYGFLKVRNPYTDIVPTGCSIAGISRDLKLIECN